MSDYLAADYIRKRMEERDTSTAGGGIVNFSQAARCAYFNYICKEIKNAFFADWENGENTAANLEIQKRAIIGYEKEKAYFKTRIAQLLKEKGYGECQYPAWYKSPEDAIYHENWGLAGLSEWFNAEYQNSSSAKIIGENIFFMVNGRMQLMPQKISGQRLQQLIKAFLLLTPAERMDKDYHEVYLLDGTRVTIFVEPMAKAGQSSIIFRRYIIPRLSFEEQANRGTIPAAAIPFLRAMVKVGYNVVFMGAVRTAKTSFLSTWQSYEDTSLEGVLVETDPEIPLHKIMPSAPNLQLLADGEKLKQISKNLLRSDADYFIMAEARDGVALDTALRIAAKGTKRLKMTFHSRNPKRFPLEASMEIVKACGGDLQLTMQHIAANFDYLFHFIQLADKSKKRLKGIYEMSLSEGGEISVLPVCIYNVESDSWKFYKQLGEDKIAYGMESNSQAFKEMRSELWNLASL